MKAQSTLPSKALDPGADLWIIPDRRTSSWSKKIDWYLQFLISKAMIHKPPQISAEITKRMQENDHELFSHELGHSSPLLILSERQLPNKKTVHLPFLGDQKSWVEQVHQVWSGFNSPSLRVFLPKGIESKDFINAWPSSKNKANPPPISFVIDEQE